MQKCSSERRLLAGTKILALAACDAKAAAKGIAPSPTCETKAKTAFMVGWSKVHAHGEAGCPTMGDVNDVNTIEALVDQHQTDLEGALVIGGKASKCTALQLRAAGRNAACKLRCAAKAARKGVALDRPTVMGCLTACRAKLRVAFSRARAMRRGACHTSGDTGTIDALAEAFVNVVANFLPPTTTTTTATTTSTTLTNCIPSDDACTEDAACCTGICNKRTLSLR